MHARLEDFDSRLLSGSGLDEHTDTVAKCAGQLGFEALICSEGYYQIDPVQYLATSSISPFIWSCLPQDETILKHHRNHRHAPVSDYLQDARLACGATIPIHLPRGGSATLTGLRSHTSEHDLTEARRHLADFSLLAHALQEAAYPKLLKNRVQAVARAVHCRLLDN